MSFRKVDKIYVGSYLLNSPLFAIYGLLPFIFYKELHASNLQITLLITIKPVVALGSAYWSSAILNRPNRLKGNLIWATILGVTPTIFFPFINNNWLFLLCFAAYFFTERAIIPTWLEILKINLPSSKMNHAVARGSLISFVAASLIPILICPYLDRHIFIWKWLFLATAVISLFRVCLQFLMLGTEPKQPMSNTINFGESHFLIRPWVTGFRLLKQRPDFAIYQLIFFFGGMGIMVTQPALPKFVEHVLHFSYTEIAIAIALCKGIGFVIANPLWLRWIRNTNPYIFCSVVTVSAAISLILVIFAPQFKATFYLAFFCYGVMQAGSQLSWQLGGTWFSGDDDSSPYTSVNVIMVGIRGCIGPFIGGLVCSLFGVSLPYVIGTILCLIGGACGLLGSRRYGAISK